MSSNWKSTLTDVLKEHNGVRKNGAKVSHLTREKRGATLFAGFEELRKMGYKLDDVRQFKGRHMQALANAWEKRDLAARTIQNNISAFRLFAGWIGKAGMVLPTEAYVSPEKARCTSINREDKSWSAKGIDTPAMIEQVRQMDPRTAMQLELQQVFGLRPSESMQIRPHLADQGSYLAVNWGTKGGRDRTQLIETEAQREVLERAKIFALTPSASMSHPARTLRQEKRHYYEVMDKCGITKKASGATSYGLRHEHANDKYREITGQDSPVRGGAPVDSQTDDRARRIIAEELGHSRLDITTHYLGR